MPDVSLPPDLAALCALPTVKVRFEFSCPPFRAYWRWNGIERSVARWGPFAARDRAYELFAPRIHAAIDRWFEDQRAARRQKATRRQIADLLGEDEPLDCRVTP